MVTLKQIKLTDAQAVYEYYPESYKDDTGKITLNRITGEKEYTKQAKGDTRNKYAAHALRRIEEYNSTGEFKKEDMVAWY